MTCRRCQSPVPIAMKARTDPGEQSYCAPCVETMGEGYERNLGDVLDLTPLEFE